MSVWGRIAARLGLRNYAAAKQPRGRATWAPPRTGPNRPIAGAGATIAARAHDAVRNNAYAARIVDVWTANLVGTGITTSWPRQSYADVWQAWAESTECDAAGALTLAGIQEIAVRAMVQGGESLIWARPVPVTAKNPVGLSLLVMEGDRLDWAYTGRIGDNAVVQGVEIDGNGRPVAYHITREWADTGMVLPLTTERIRVPASQIIHLYRRRRPGQLRDVSWLAPILWSLRDLDEYDTALIRKAYVEACLTVVVSGDDTATISGEESSALLRDSTGAPIEQLEPQMILYRNGAGSDITTITPSGGGDHAKFAQRHLQSAAVGTGLTYDQVSGDLTGANYSSLRAGKIEFRRHLEQVQYTLLVPVLCQRIAEWFFDAARDARLFAGPMPKLRHVPPAPEMVDPAKDGAALLMLVRAGFLPPQEVAGMLGSDFDQVMQAIADANAKADDLGLILDSDPRRTARTGGAQDARQNAVIEIAATGTVGLSDPAPTEGGTP